MARASGRRTPPLSEAGATPGALSAALMDDVPDRLTTRMKPKLFSMLGQTPTERAGPGLYGANRQFGACGFSGPSGPASTATVWPQSTP
jgi:hypothetical protein